MKESIKMADSDGSLNKIAKIERTKILPLRWISNICGEIASDHLVKAIHMNYNHDNGLKYKYHSRVWVIFNNIYSRWGTYYILDRSN